MQSKKQRMKKKKEEEHTKKRKLSKNLFLKNPINVRIDVVIFYILFLREIIKWLYLIYN